MNVLIDEVQSTPKIHITKLSLLDIQRNEVDDSKRRKAKYK
jgi:hypothetical protein